MQSPCKSIAILLLIISNCFHTSGENQNVGVVYSPFIQKGDRETSRSYSRDMVKVMLEDILGAGYNIVTTYGVGSPPVPCDSDSASECTSIGHTPIAAAEINEKKHHLELSVYLGLYKSPIENQTYCEIEVGFELVKRANEVFNGTVQAIVFPSVIEFDDLIDESFVNTTVRIVSARARKENLKYGVRISDCQQIQTGDWSKFMDFVALFDFIICFISPDESNFKFGIEEFKNMSITIVRQADEYIKMKTNSSEDTSVNVILETGWPADAVMKPPNTVQDLAMYWNLISEWARTTGKLVFLHEFVDNPWKDTQWPLAGHFGRWEYNTDEPNLLSKDSLILKHQGVKPILGPASLTYVGVTVGLLVVVFLISMIVLLYKRVLRIEGATVAQYALGEHDLKTFFEGVIPDATTEEYFADVWETSPYNTQLEINKNYIKIDKSEDGLLGKGEFGVVYKGKLTSDRYQVMGKETNVAVKMTGPCCSKTQIKCILSEIKMLGYLGSHPYICSILGAYTKDISKGVVYFVMELCPHGSLKAYLLKNRNKFADDIAQAGNDGGNEYVFQSTNETILMTERQLVRWAFEIASAMKFISSKNVIHSDLAARNILLNADHVVKVTDFGLSRRTSQEDTNYSKSGTEPLPWKWLAPESLDMRLFSTKSDVWSYGITIWEILSLGSSPRYEGVHSWNELHAHLKSGKRLEPPENKVELLYKLMSKCWSFDSSERPTFTEIVQLLMASIDNDYKTLTE